MSLLKKIKEEKDRLRSQQLSQASIDQPLEAKYTDSGDGNLVEMLPKSVLRSGEGKDGATSREDSDEMPLFTGSVPFLFNLHSSGADLDSYRIVTEHDEIYYIPDAISSEFEEFLLSATQSSSWRELSTRDVQLWGRGLPPAALGMEPHEEAPAWLDACLSYFSDLTGLSDPSSGGINHVLVNRYYPGQGVPHHTDGPRYASCAAILSMGAPIAMSLRKRREPGDITYENSKQDVFQLFLEPRSILMFRGDLYENYLHGIEARCSDFIDSSFRNVDFSTHRKGAEVCFIFALFFIPLLYSWLYLRIARCFLFL
jgi:alkylated DNA repair protein alkB family protein 6